MKSFYDSMGLRFGSSSKFGGTETFRNNMGQTVFSTRSMGNNKDFFDRMGLRFGSSSKFGVTETFRNNMGQTIMSVRG